MKIQVISDLHLEFANAPVIKNTGADVLVLGGDICVAEHVYRNASAGTLPSASLILKSELNVS